MTKKEYLSQLDKYLAPLSAVERQEITGEIEERFKVAQEKGESAKQVIEKLGKPEFLAQSYLKTEGKEMVAGMTTDAASPTPRTGLKIFLALVLIGVNGLLIAWLWFALFVTLGGLIFAGLAVVFGGLLVMIAPALTNFGLAITANLPPPLFFSLGLTVSLWGVLGTLLVIWATIWAVKLLIKYIKFNIELVKKV